MSNQKTPYDEFMSKLRELTSDSKKIYIFRGQNKSRYELNCSGKRRIFDEFKKKCKENEKPIITNKHLLKNQKDLLEITRQKGYGLNGSRELSDLEVLSNLQHNEGATLLMDFTKDIDVALFFAVYDGETQSVDDGAIFILEVSNDDKFYSVKHYDLKNSNLLEDALGEKNNKYYVWEPPDSEQNKRPRAQKSIFVFGKAEVKEKDYIKIIITKDEKDLIRRELEKFRDINLESLFADIQGLAKANSQKAPIRNIDEYEFNTEGLPPDPMQYDSFLLATNYQISVDAFDAKAYFMRGTIKGIQGDLSDALIDLNTCIEIDQKFAAAYCHRGITKSELGHHKEAIEDFDKAIEFDPNDEISYYNRGNAKRKLYLYSEAIENYNKTILINPRFIAAYINRGNAKGEMGCHQEAIEDYNKAIEIDPNFAMIYNNRGNAKWNLGHCDEAIKDYDEAIRLDPKDAMAYNNRGVAKADLGNHEDAIQDYDMVISLDPKVAGAYINRGITRAKLSRFNEAIEDLKKARELATQQNDKQVLEMLENYFNEDGSLKDNWKELLKDNLKTN